MQKLTYIVALCSLLLFSCKDKQDNSAVAVQVKPVVAARNIAAHQGEVKRDAVIAYAKQFMGLPYKYATADPAVGFDCSGFVNYVYKHFDIALPRSSSGFKDIGIAKKPKDFKVGDILVFYGHKDRGSIGHLGIICEANGMQSRFIHASSGKEMAVTISELGSDGYTARFYKCIDPFLL